MFFSVSNKALRSPPIAKASLYQFPRSARLLTVTKKQVAVQKYFPTTPLFKLAEQENMGIFLVGRSKETTNISNVVHRWKLANCKRGIPRKNLPRADRKGESLASKGLIMIMMMSMITITMPTIIITMMMMVMMIMMMMMMILVVLVLVVVVIMMMMKMVTMMMIKMTMIVTMLKRRGRRRMMIMIVMVTVVVAKQNLFTNSTIENKSDLHTEQETWRLFPACSLYGRYTLQEANSSKKSFNK